MTLDDIRTELDKPTSVPPLEWQEYIALLEVQLFIARRVLAAKAREQAAEIKEQVAREGAGF